MHFTNQTPKKETPKFKDGQKIEYFGIPGIVIKAIHKGLGMGFKYAITLDEEYNGHVNYLVEEKSIKKCCL